MSNMLLTEVNFYLLGYYVACLHRHEGYCDQYEDSEEGIEKRAALSHLTSMCRSFKKLAEMVSRDLGVDFEDIVPDDRDAFLDAINEMEGRSPVKEFVKHASPETAFRAFVMGDYIGGEIGFVHEYGKMLLPKIGEAESRDLIASLLDMKVGQFDEYMSHIPDALEETVTSQALQEIVGLLRLPDGRNEEELRECYESFFSIYAAVTEYYLALRTGNGDAEDEETALYFISYARRNRRKANQVELLLLRENKRTWRDETDVRAGAKLVSSLYKGIDEAGTFVCILSEYYLQSSWCMEELERAINRTVSLGRPRIAVLKVDGCDIPALLSSRACLDAETREKLMLAVDQVMQEEGA